MQTISTHPGSASGDEEAPLMDREVIELDLDFKEDDAPVATTRSTGKVWKHLEVCVAIMVFSGFGVMAREGLAALSNDTLTFQGRNSMYMTCNMVGTFVIAFMALVPSNLRHGMHTGITVGFCGTLTTFSSFIWEAEADNKKRTVTVDGVTMTAEDNIRRAGSVGLVLTNITTTLALCICCWLIGKWLAQTMKNLNWAPRMLRGTGQTFIYGLFAIGWVTMIVLAICNPQWVIFPHAKFDDTDEYAEGARAYSMLLIVLLAWPGAYIRYLVCTWLNPDKNGFFWGTFACNMVAVIIAATLTIHDDLDRWGRYDWRQFRIAMKIGFCGALSTISSFINDIFKGFQRAKDQAAEAQEQLPPATKKQRHSDYAAGYWSAWSPIVYMVATLAGGVTIVSIFYFCLSSDDPKPI